MHWSCSDHALITPSTRNFLGKPPNNLGIKRLILVAKFSSLFDSELRTPSLVYAIIFGLAFEVKLSDANITWKTLSFPDGTTLPKLCLADGTKLERFVCECCRATPQGLSSVAWASDQEQSHLERLVLDRHEWQLSGWISVTLNDKLALSKRNAVTLNNKLALYERSAVALNDKLAFSEQNAVTLS